MVSRGANKSHLFSTTSLASTAPAATMMVVPRDLRLGFIDFDFAAFEAGTIELLDSLLCLVVARHLDEGKARALTRITICNQVG